MRIVLLLSCWFLVHQAPAQHPVMAPLHHRTLLGSVPLVPLERMVLPAPWSYQRLGMFCKLDVQMERRLRMPVLFRLGDVHRVEAMEGKGPLREVDPR